jgi:cyclohexanecarboxylate-CoA ligase
MGGQNGIEKCGTSGKSTERQLSDIIVAVSESIFRNTMSEPNQQVGDEAGRRIHPGLRPDSHLTADLAVAYEHDGSWTRHPLHHLLTDASARHPNRTAGVTYSESGDLVARVTYGELETRSARLADGLIAHGIQSGDVVAVMMSNSAEYAALVFAILSIGAIYTGIPVAYGEREMSAILKTSNARALALSPAFRGTDLTGTARRIRRTLPGLSMLLIAGSDRPLPSGSPDEYSLDDLCTAPHGPKPSIDAGSVCHLGFTSGTTGEPKGVMNTHQTLDAVFRLWLEHVGAEALGDPMVQLVASPLGHHTGFLWGILMTTYLGGTAVYLQRWDAGAALDIIRDEQVTCMFGAPIFLQDLVRAVEGSDEEDAETRALGLFVMAGAPVPRGLPRAASSTLRGGVIPAWGMTEYGIGISCAPYLPADSLTSDGVPVPGCEVRIVTHGDGARSPAIGTSGDLEIRGPGLFLGYYRQEDTTAESFDAQGWFRTGDTALWREDGCIELQGRNKDIIIRGGENIPVPLVESLLFDHPGILDVALIGVPDERLGERSCAVIVARPGSDLTLESIRHYLSERGLSFHFLPERLKMASELPKTPSGKIRKVELREHFSERNGRPLRSGLSRGRRDETTRG